MSKFGLGSFYTDNTMRNIQKAIDDFGAIEELGKKTTPSSSSASRHYKPKSTGPSTSTMGAALFTSLMADLERKADKWALETLAEFRNSVPVDTGNLRDSLDITNRIVNKPAGRISITVGVDEGKILPPPFRMRRKNGKMRTMPDYDYSPYVLGDAAPYAGTAYGVADAIGRGRANIGGRSITSTFQDIAIKNAKKIF